MTFSQQKMHLTTKVELCGCCGQSHACLLPVLYALPLFLNNDTLVSPHSCRRRHFTLFFREGLNRFWMKTCPKRVATFRFKRMIFRAADAPKCVAIVCGALVRETNGALLVPRFLFSAWTCCNYLSFSRIPSGHDPLGFLTVGIIDRPATQEENYERDFGCGSGRSDWRVQGKTDKKRPRVSGESCPFCTHGYNCRALPPFLPPPFLPPPVF